MAEISKSKPSSNAGPPLKPERQMQPKADSISKPNPAMKEIKFPNYPLIGRYNFGSGIVEIIEKEFDHTNPYESMPYLEITDDGVAQVFFEKGTFTCDTEDMPQFRCFPERITSHQLPGYAEGPFKRRLIDYPLGYYEPPTRKTEYRFRMRINPEQVIFRQGSYYSMNPMERKMCRRDFNPFPSISEKQFRLNFRQLLYDFSQLSLKEKRKVFCSHKYNLAGYVKARLRGKAKSELSIPRKLSKHYSGGKYRFNHITRQIERVKKLNKKELSQLEKALTKQKPRIELNDIPYILPIEYSRLHPIAKKFSIVKRDSDQSNRIDWSLFQGQWIPPQIHPKKKKKNRVKFQQLQTNKNMAHAGSTQAITQIRIYDPDNPEDRAEKLRQRAGLNTAHPLGRLLKCQLNKPRSPETNKHTDS